MSAAPAIRRGGWRRWLLVALLALVAGVCAWRAVELARHGWHPSAPGEHRWMGWGQGNGWERAVLAALADEGGTGVPRGAELVLQVETAGGVRPNWIRAQAQYLWPGRQVAGVEIVPPGETVPPGRTVPLEKRAADEGRRRLTLTVAAPRPDGPATATALVPSRPARDLGGLALLLLAALVVGELLLPRSAERGTVHGPVLAAVLGLSLLVPVAVLSAWAFPDLPLAVVLPLVAGLPWALLRNRSHPFFAAPGPVWPGSWRRPLRALRGALRDPWNGAALAVIAVALALFAAKLFLAPLWSWDHVSIWGLKARVMGALGPLPGLLESAALERSSTSYPSGLPLLLWTAALGAPPTPLLFKAVHLLCGVGAVLLVRDGVRRAAGRKAGESPLAENGAAALVAASPLLWDTELLGLADLPLALWALAAVVVLVSRQCRRAHLLVAGAVLGFLPWIKEEGTTLALLLLAVGVALVRPRHRLRATGWLALPFAVQTLLLHLVQSTLGAHGEGFFAGDWTARLTARLGEAGPIAGRLARELLAPHWLGGWVLFAAVSGILVVRLPAAGRGEVNDGARRPARLLAVVVVAQLAVYAGVYLATYIDPMAHIESSFRRIAAALWPLAAMVVGLGLGRTGSMPGKAGSTNVATETKQIGSPAG